MKKGLKRMISLMLTVATLFNMVFMMEPTRVEALDYSNFDIELNRTEMTVYTGSVNNEIRPYITLYVRQMCYMGQNDSDEEYDKLNEKLEKSMKWTTSNKDVVMFIGEGYNEFFGGIYGEGNDELLETINGVSRCWLKIVGEGTSTIKVYCGKKKETFECKVTVKKAGITCDKNLYYTGNKYALNLAGAAPVEYKSSNKAVASVDPNTGLVTTHKAGKAVISCTDTEGNVYKKTLKVEKARLMYQELTTYYFTGLYKGEYHRFPLVALGTKIEKWESSNKKVVKVKKKGNRVGNLEIHGTGKCTVTGIAKNGKKYKCKVTVVGGKPWSGLVNGYCPTLNTIKKHGYYKDVNKLQDLGDVIFCITNTNNGIDLKNGNPKKIEGMPVSLKVDYIFRERYPGKSYRCAQAGDMVGYTSGKKYGRMWVDCWYVNSDE